VLQYSIYVLLLIVYLYCLYRNTCCKIHDNAPHQSMVMMCMLWKGHGVFLYNFILARVLLSEGSRQAKSLSIYMSVKLEQRLLTSLRDVWYDMRWER
jgi:hypothetical protein